MQPDQTRLDEAVRDVDATLRAVEAWTNGRLAGTLADARRKNVIRAVMGSLYGSLCGNAWRRAEQSYVAQPEAGGGLPALGSSVSSAQEHRGFAPALKLNFQKAQEGVEAAVHWFADVAKRYGVCSDDALCRFALRLASDPAGVRIGYAGQLTKFMTDIAENPVLLRGARLVVLMVARSEDADPESVSRWRW